MISQHLANGLQTGAITALVGVGFFVVYRTADFFHFAHGIVLTTAAYFVFFLTQTPLNIPLIYVILSIVLILGFGLLIEGMVYRPLRSLGGSSTSLLIASLGIYSLVQNSISLIFGDDTLSFRWWAVEAGWPLFGARITTVQMIITICPWLLIFFIWSLLNYTNIGKKIKSVGSNPELALIVGIDVKRIYLWAMGIGSALGGIGGILIACDVDMMPTMGMQPLMMGIVAVIMGGNTIWGTAFGAFLLGMAKNIGVIWLPTKWQDAIVFIILLVFLLFRPQGFSGRQKKEIRI